MSTVGYVLILVGALLFRQVAAGRSRDTAQDMKDFFLGFITWDWDSVNEILTRPGTTSQASIASDVAEVAAGTAASLATGAALLQACVKRGQAAKGYRFGTLPPEFGVGPNWYDCSGLVWRGLQDIGVLGKRSARTTTFGWPAQARGIATQVQSPMVGDIVVWQRGGTSGHMGVVSGEGKFYGAQSSRTGIKELEIAPITGRISYWRLNPPKNSSSATPAPTNGSLSI